jgi:isocitrate/isopropylmalate dehydrogenase
LTIHSPEARGATVGSVAFLMKDVVSQALSVYLLKQGVLTGLFLETGREVARQYAGRIEMNDRLVDACAMELVIDPWQFV